MKLYVHSYIDNTMIIIYTTFLRLHYFLNSSSCFRPSIYFHEYTILLVLHYTLHATILPDKDREWFEGHIYAMMYLQHLCKEQLFSEQVKRDVMHYSTKHCTHSFPISHKMHQPQAVPQIIVYSTFHTWLLWIDKTFNKV